jgi:signal transduction histidine kinase
MRCIKRIFQEVLHYGETQGMHFYEKKNVLLLNRLCVLLVFLFAVMATISAFRFDEIIVPFVLIGMAVLLFGTLMLNKIGRTVLSRFLLSIFIPLFVLFMSIYTKRLGVSADFILYLAPRMILVITLLIPVLVFGYSQWKKSFSALLPGVLAFVFYDQIHLLFGISYENLAMNFMHYSIYNIILTLFLLFMILSVFFLQSTNLVYERKISVINEDLIRSRDKLLETNKDLKLAKEKAEESNRLKMAFLSNISHEIRTPMNSIIGFSELIAMRKMDEKMAIKYANVIKTDANQLLNIIENIIEVSKLEASQIEISKTTFSLLTLLNEVYETALKRYYDKLKEIGFLVNKGEANGAEVIYSDKNIIKTVLMQFIDNAVKYTEQGYVELGYSMPDNERLTLFVKDTGVGINLADADYIFEPFRRVNETYNSEHRGAGIGLAIAKQYTLSLNGKIWLESIPGEGATFFISIPAK